MSMTGIGGMFMLVAIVVVSCVVVWIPLWRIASKMGWPGWLGLLGVLVAIPGVNIVLLWILALLEWPIERRLRETQPVVR